jgi:ABC-type nickel/cobalt efflux system permease component RcnA
MAAQRHVESVLGGRLTPLVIGLAFLLAILLGAGHAALPGHGKTVMAAYFAGRRGRIRDALAVGGTVTHAHTGGVLLVGLLLSTSTALAGERLLAWLGAASGVLVAAVGLGMLVSALRTRRARRADPHGAHGHTHGPHGHTHDADGNSHSAHGHTHDSHSHTHDLRGDDHHTHDDAETGHEHGDHSHGHGAGRHHHRRGLWPDHQHDHEPRRPGGRLGLAGIGLAGGLVPSPSALVVLLGAIGLGRAGLGVLLVLAYGIGMAGTLTAVGLLLVVAQRKLGHLIARGGRTARVGGLLARLTGRVSANAPTATAALVVLVGLGMGVRAVG